MDLSPVCHKRKKDSFTPRGDEDPFRVNTSSERNIDMELLHMSKPQWLNKFSGVMKNVYGPVTTAKTIYEDDEGYLIIISLPFVDLQKHISTPVIRRNDRTFELSDPAPEHCPSGEFIKAYYDGPGSVLEIIVPKLRAGPEEHEVHVCLKPHLGGSDLMLTR
ncbi:hypothetical protein MLD38_024956 [Melastoma candidum]|uniref:Uncharacterized protein n=1 Tax=Melastoma candidum TaxID=119954 RepID=A0ACB9NWX9_9MYRT|nr:hypothetical protein MLD38_024956 [Melastoma candidum]